MIEIYTKKQDSPDWILLNDMYFNVYTGNEEISEYEAKLIQQVDKAKLTTDKHIETRYGIGTIRNLSTSCKTLLNIVKHPEKVVSVEECGSDVLKIIFSLDNIKIYMSRPSLVEISDTKVIKVCKDENDSINLLRKTTLDVLDEESLNAFMAVFKDEELASYNLPEVEFKINSPAIIVIPIAIYV